MHGSGLLIVRLFQLMPSVSEKLILDSGPAAEVVEIKQEIQETMWKYAGIIRSEDSLKRAEGRLRQLSRKLQKIPVTLEKLEAENMLSVARLIAHGALLRKESRGAHYRKDYPEPGTKIEKSAEPYVIEIYYLNIERIREIFKLISGIIRRIRAHSIQYEEDIIRLKIYEELNKFNLTPKDFIQELKKNNLSSLL